MKLCVQAQDIMKLAEEVALHKSAESAESGPTAQYLLNALNGGMFR